MYQLILDAFLQIDGQDLHVLSYMVDYEFNTLTGCYLSARHTIIDAFASGAFDEFPNLGFNYRCVEQ